jgi:formylglycine-generating enzyme required for sulfatase activity
MKTHIVTFAALALLACNTAPAANNVTAMKRLKAEDWTVPTVGMEMKLIPAGTFSMGSPNGEMERNGGT